MDMFFVAEDLLNLQGSRQDHIAKAKGVNIGTNQVILSTVGAVTKAFLASPRNLNFERGYEKNPKNLCSYQNQYPPYVE
jgi:hypothetical protein